jgi:hypothetical protein
MRTTRVVSCTHSKVRFGRRVSGRRCATHLGHDPRNRPQRIRRLRAAGLLSGAIVSAALLANPRAALAAPDPPTITNNIAYYQGNQSNGISLSSGAITVLRVNELSTSITPQTGTEGIQFLSSSGGNVTVDGGVSGTNVMIATSGAAGIHLQSSGVAPYPNVNPVLGIPIPGDNVPGGIVQVNSYSDITTEGDYAPGIQALSYTTGYPQAVIDDLNKFDPSNITYSVSSVLGSAGNVGQAVLGSVIDTNGLPVPGNGGTFTMGGSVTVVPVSLSSGKVALRPR